MHAGLHVLQLAGVAGMMPLDVLGLAHWVCVRVLCVACMFLLSTRQLDVTLAPSHARMTRIKGFRCYFRCYQGMQILHCKTIYHCLVLCAKKATGIFAILAMWFLVYSFMWFL